MGDPSAQSEPAKASLKYKGKDLRLVPEDLEQLVVELNHLLGQDCRKLELALPDVSSRSMQSGDLVLLHANGRTIALKRCAKNSSFLRREIIVHHLRKMFGVPDYPIIHLNGLKLRSVETKQNPEPLKEWESIDLLMIDFGDRGARKDFNKISAEKISLPETFFEQYGRVCAFNYIIGAKDRHRGNFIYDLSAKMVYSVDHEERPYDANQKFNFDAENINILENIKSLLPEMPEERNKMLQAFIRGFKADWQEVMARFSSEAVASDIVLSNEDASLDILHIKSALRDCDPDAIISKFNLR